MQMNTHPLAGAQPHLRFMGSGPSGYTISVLLPTADAGMTPRDCARSGASSIVRRFGVKTDELVTRQTNEITTVMLFPFRVAGVPIIQLKAFVLSGYAGTHCLEVHLSKVVTDEGEVASWLKGFTTAKIEKY
jgi:hypothetical protein